MLANAQRPDKVQSKKEVDFAVGSLVCFAGPFGILLLMIHVVGSGEFCKVTGVLREWPARQHMSVLCFSQWRPRCPVSKAALSIAFASFLEDVLHLTLNSQLQGMGSLRPVLLQCLYPL